MSVRIDMPRLGQFGAWRDAVRRLIANNVPPADVNWVVDGDPSNDLFDAGGEILPSTHADFSINVPKALVDVARQAICARNKDGRQQEAFVLSHTLIDRHHRQGNVDLADRRDDTVQRVLDLARAIRRDKHKMKAFVRFREVPGESDRRRFLSWFEPSHRIEESIAPFFARRFGDMDWVIVTPEVVTTFDDGRLHFDAKASTKPDLDDDAEELWKTYFSSIFNPARLMVKAMQAEMPKKYWHNLPEAALIPDMIANARAREQAMRIAAPTLAPARANAIRAQLKSAGQSRSIDIETQTPHSEAGIRERVMSKRNEQRFLHRAYEAKNDADTRAFYDDWSSVYDDELSENDYQQPIRCAEALLALMTPDEAIEVIDIGCGSGLSGAALKRAGYGIIDGCDFSPGMLAKAKSVNVYRRLFEANLNEPPLDVADDRYDAATCVGVFSFGHVVANALDDIIRVIKPGGSLVIGLNDHFYQEGSLTGKLATLDKEGIIDNRTDTHGDHIRGTGLTGWVITARKRA